MILSGEVPCAESAAPKAARHAAKVKRPAYDEIIPTQNPRYAKVRRNGKWGCIDKWKDDKEVIPPRYEEVGDFSFDHSNIIVKLNGKWGFIDLRTGQIVVPIKYTAIKGYDRSWSAMVRRNGKWGCIDLRTGQIVIPIEYDAIQEFEDYSWSAKIQRNGKWGYLNVKSNKEFIETKWDEISGFFSTTGTMIPNEITIQFERALKKYDQSDYYNGRTAAVRLKDKWGLIDRYGNELLPPKYSRVEWFQNGAAKVAQNGLWGFIDEIGREIVPPLYDEVGVFSEDMAAVAFKSLDTKKYIYGYVDKTGKVIVEPKYGSAGEFKNGSARVWANGKERYIDKTGKEIPLAKYTDRPRQDEDKLIGYLARVRLKDKWGYIDHTGKEIFPVQYDELPAALTAHWFNRFKLNGKYGYLDPKANVVAPAKYDDAPEDLLAGKRELRMVKVSADGKYGYLSRDTGKEIIPVKYDDVPEFWEYSKVPEKMKVKLNGKWGYIDLQGREISAFHYEDDPCAFEKNRGDHYVFGDQAEMKQQPDAASARIAQLPAGTKIKVIGKTDKELTIGDVTDTWYEVKYENKRGYVWGASLADAAGLVKINGKEAVAVIRSRTPDTDYCYHRKFEMQLVADGKIIDQLFDKKLSNGTVKVRSLKYETYKDFSAPLSMLVMTFDGYHSDFDHTVELYYYYLEDGKLAKVLDWGLFVEHKGFEGTGTVILPDKNAGKDTVTVKYKLSQPLFGKDSGEKHYTWSWEEKTFSLRNEKNLR
jgi:hypothetical protein